MPAFVIEWDHAAQLYTYTASARQEEQPKGKIRSTYNSTSKNAEKALPMLPSKTTHLHHSIVPGASLDHEGVGDMSCVVN